MNTIIYAQLSSLTRAFVQRLLSEDHRICLLAPSAEAARAWKQVLVGESEVVVNVFRLGESICDSSHFFSGDSIDSIFAFCHSGLPAKLGYGDFEKFTEHLTDNLTNVTALTNILIPKLKHQGFGHFLYVDSMTGWLGEYGHAAQTTAHYGVLGFSEVLAKEVNPHGVRVSFVERGYVRTPGESLRRPRTRHPFGSEAYVTRDRNDNDTEVIDRVMEILASEEWRVRYFVECNEERKVSWMCTMSE